MIGKIINTETEEKALESMNSIDKLIDKAKMIARL